MPPPRVVSASSSSSSALGVTTTSERYMRAFAASLAACNHQVSSVGSWSVATSRRAATHCAALVLLLLLLLLRDGTHHPHPPCRVAVHTGTGVRKVHRSPPARRACCWSSTLPLDGRVF
jgi:hypothetical protein